MQVNNKNIVEKLSVPLGVKITAIAIGFMYLITIVGVVFAVFLWKGKNWARIAVIIMCGIFAIFEFFSGVSIGVSTDAFYSIVPALINVVIIWYLLASKNANRYFGQMQ